MSKSEMKKVENLLPGKSDEFCEFDPGV